MLCPAFKMRINVQVAVLNEGKCEVFNTPASFKNDKTNFQRSFL